MMPDSWSRGTVGDIAAPTRNALVGGPFGSELVSTDYVVEGVPVIRGSNMGAGRWVSGEFAYVSPAKARSLAGNLARPGDVVFTQRGTLGQVALVPPEPYCEYLVSQSQMKLTVDSRKADPLFVYYAFSTAQQQGYIRRNAIQTGVPHTNLGILRSTPLLLPPVAEQRAIARVLGSLDDKIELNRRTNETLEAMAQAVFRSWFVDFGPVRAKASGRQPAGMDVDTAALFPASFERTTLGDVPDGWVVGTLSDVASFAKGVSYRSAHLTGSDAWLVTLKSIARGGGYRPDGLKPYCGPFREDQRLHRGEVVISQTDVTQAAEVIGRAARVPGGLNAGTLVASLDLLIVRGRRESTSGEYLYGLLSQESFHGYACAHANGTTVLHLDASAVPEYPIIVPGPAVVKAYTRLVRPVYQLADSNAAQSLTLSTIRDVLLPKLMSGEMRAAAAQGLLGGGNGD